MAQRPLCLAHAIGMVDSYADVMYLPAPQHRCAACIMQHAVEGEKDAQKLARQGYAVTSTTEKTPRSGCLRTLTFGVFFQPKTRLIVTYTLQAPKK